MSTTTAVRGVTAGVAAVVALGVVAVVTSSHRASGSTPTHAGTLAVVAAAVVPRGSSIRIPVTVMRLALPGQDSCRDATFPLTLTGVVSPGRATTNAG
jgi:hypothetical protein